MLTATATDPAAEAHLRKLLNEQRKQVDAIKKATNYDSTRKLIEQYDDSMAGGLGRPGPGQQPQTPQRGMPQQAAAAAGKGGAQTTGGPTTPGASPKGTPRAPGHLVGAGGTPAQASASRAPRCRFTAC